MSGFIYAVECGDRIKIGWSTKPEFRFNKIASDAPFPCTLLGCWPGTRADEFDVHSKFRELRQHGEWFKATTALLAFISENVVTPTKTGKRFTVLEGDSPLTAWRKKSGLRQQDLAALLNCGAAYVSQLESGVSGATLETAIKIAELSKGEVPIESLVALRKREAA